MSNPFLKGIEPPSGNKHWVVWITLPDGKYSLHKDSMLRTQSAFVDELMEWWMSDRPVFYAYSGNGAPELISREHIIKMTVKEDNK